MAGSRWLRQEASGSSPATVGGELENVSEKSQVKGVERYRGLQLANPTKFQTSENLGFGFGQSVERQIDRDDFSIFKPSEFQSNPCFEEDSDDFDLTKPKKRKRSLSVHEEDFFHAEGTEDVAISDHFLTAVPGSWGCRE